MVQHLTDMTIQKVSTVERGMNARRFAILKRDDGVDPEKRSLLAKLAGALGFSIADVEKAETKTVDGKAYPASDWAYVPDPDKPSEWRLRLTSEPGGDPDPRIVGAAIAALGPGGFRGQQVQIPADDLPKVKARVRAAWIKAHPDAMEDDMPEAIAKGQTFASIVAGQQLTTALDDNFWSLKDALWSAIYARDEADQLLSPEARDALVAQNLDEFKAYLLEAMHSGVTKADQPAPDPLVGGLMAAVRKVGKKISAARLERFKTGVEGLLSLLVEFEESDDSEVEKRADAQGDDDMALTDEDVQKLTTATTAALEPRFAAIEKRLPAEVEQSAGDGSGGDDAGKVPDAVVDAFALVAQRLEAVEKAQARGSRTSLGGQDAGEVKKSMWAGMF